MKFWKIALSINIDENNRKRENSCTASERVSYCRYIFQQSKLIDRLRNSRVSLVFLQLSKVASRYLFIPPVSSLVCSPFFSLCVNILSPLSPSSLLSAIQRTFSRGSSIHLHSKEPEEGSFKKLLSLLAVPWPNVSMSGGFDRYTSTTISFRYSSQVSIRTNGQFVWRNFYQRQHFFLANNFKSGWRIRDTLLVAVAICSWYEIFHGCVLYRNGNHVGKKKYASRHCRRSLEFESTYGKQ